MHCIRYLLNHLWFLLLPFYPHTFMNGKLETVSRDVRPGEVFVAAAAGGIQYSVKSILKWHRMFLNEGISKMVRFFF